MLRLITAKAEKKVAQARARGISKTVRAMVVGVPNVGNSTLINRLNGSAVSERGRKIRGNDVVSVTGYEDILVKTDEL